MPSDERWWTIRVCPVCESQPEWLDDGERGCGRHREDIPVRDFKQVDVVAVSKRQGAAEAAKGKK